MTHVSKKALAVKTSLRIKTSLVRALKEHEGVIVESLLTPTEHVMLAKRLAIIVMLDKDYSTYQIREALNVSTSTIARFDQLLLSGVFKTIQRKLHGKDRASLLGIFEFIFVRSGDAAHKKRVAAVRRELFS